MKLSTKSALFAASALSMNYAMPAFAQNEGSGDASMGNDIVVTARRTEEKLQDVPISITVLNEKALANNNISSAKDIATYTPGLSTNNRFGSDNTTWTIRGFTQEQRTTATVGTYFADVVAPRGSGATQGGDGAGPGNLFDLANVQVLKGPQGTLQGRNSTGGAVMLVPKKPTDRFEGYIEGSAGDYSMWRLQAVVNAPISETMRVRLGVDRQKRDGYMQNVGKIGFGPNGDAGGSLDYWAARASLVWDVTPDIENYTIGTYSRSKSTGLTPKITKAFYREPYSLVSGIAGVDNLGSTPIDIGQQINGIVTSNGLQAQNQMNYEAAHCASFWCVSNPMSGSKSETETWQVINTTTWKASDTLTVKNILSYGEFVGDQTLDLFGLYNPAGANITGSANLDAVTTPLGVRSFSATRSPEGLGIHTNAEKSFVEELQIQGKGDRFNWQGGVYFEMSDPIGKSGTAAESQTPCGPIGSAVPTYAGAATFQFDNLVCMATADQAQSLGRIGLNFTQTRFRDTAVYWQGIYNITDKLKLTGGIRYTWDKMSADFQLINLRYYTAAGSLVTNNGFGTITNILQSGFNGRNLIIPSMVNGQGVGFCANTKAFGYPGNTPARGNNTYSPGDYAYFSTANIADQCMEHHEVKTSAPTWLIGLDYKPMDNVLLYAKWSRGYRQGGVNAFGLDQVQDYNKEKVDTYEVGAKTSWGGAMPGFFNIAAFYNDFRDQQLQIGVQCNPTANCPQTTIILNTGKSHLEGFEIEAGISPFQGFRLSASYAYLHTKLTDVLDVTQYVVSRNNQLVGLDLRPVPIGSEIPNSVPHKLVLNGTYTLPLPDSYGKLSVGATMVYTSKYRAVSDPPVLVSPCPGASVNTNINTFNCGAATPAQFSPQGYGILPSSTVVNLNVNWENVGGLPVDAAFFMTNVTNEKVFLHANVQVGNGFLSNLIGEPRMWGFRLKYRFGN